MRYYNIIFSDTASGAPIYLPSLGIPLTSVYPGTPNNNPAALNIEFDIPFINLATPDNNAYLKVWGVSLQDIGNAYNLNGKFVSIIGGMSKGLPLANPAQQGLLLQGYILQAFGNWVGTEQSLDMNFTATPTGNDISGTPIQPINVPFVWQQGTQLSSALAQTFSAAYPTFTQKINISQQLVTNYTRTAYLTSLQPFADQIKAMSIDIIGGQYTGVVISTQGLTISAQDSTTLPAPVMLNPWDLIGQPTWINPGEISVKTVLRGDFNIGDVITLPPTLVTQSQQSYLRFQDKTLFTGNYQIQQIHHYGNYRQPDAASWNTTLQCTAAVKV